MYCQALNVKQSMCHTLKICKHIIQDKIQSEGKELIIFPKLRTQKTPLDYFGPDVQDTSVGRASDPWSGGPAIETLKMCSSNAHYGIILRWHKHRFNTEKGKKVQLKIIMGTDHCFLSRKSQFEFSIIQIKTKLYSSFPKIFKKN